MSTINYAQKEISCKIVYYGPGLGGKTTNLQYIHQTLPDQNRGELVSLATQQDRTLFFDFLPMELGRIKGFDIKFHLYTVPGQVYYNATRKLVLRGVDGVVFVADSQKDRWEENVNSMQNLRENLQEYGYELDTIPWVMQYNKRDLENISPVEEMEQLLNKDHVPHFESIAIKGDGVKQTLKTVSSLVLARLRAVTEESIRRKARMRSVMVSDSVAVGSQAAKAEVPLATTPTEELAPPKVTAAPAERGRIPIKPDTVASDKSQLDKVLPVEHRCVIRWHGLPVGSAFLRIRVLDSPSDDRIKYRLAGELKILAFMQRKLDKKLIFRGKRFSKSGDAHTFTDQKHDGESSKRRGESYFYLTDPPELRPALADPFCVWVSRNGEKFFHVSLTTSLGRLQLDPSGRRLPELVV